MERTLEELLKVTDKRIYGQGPYWHKNLSLQAASRNDPVDRALIVSQALFEQLTEKRACK